MNTSAFHLIAHSSRRVPNGLKLRRIWKEQDTIESQKNEGGGVSDLPPGSTARNAAFTARPYQGMRHVRLGQYTSDIAYYVE